MTVKMRKATAAERGSYNGLYPLAYVADVNGVTFAVEDLRDNRLNADDPMYEVMAPVGHIFVGLDCHSLVCTDLQDAKRRLAHEWGDVAPCLVDCHCKEEA